MISKSIVRNIPKFENEIDLHKPVAAILKIIPKNDLLFHYKIADFSNSLEFLENIAKAKGKLLKVKILLSKFF